MTLIEEIREYWDLRSSGFSEFVNYDLDKGDGAIFHRIESYLSDHEVKDILDLGCGPGYYSLLFGSKGYNVTGIDYSGLMIEEARKNAKDRNVKVEFLVMDAQKLEFPDATFDLVVSRDVFWCLEEPEKAYSEILRVLRPGGMAIVSDGNYYLYLYDDRYAKAREQNKINRPKEPMKGGHEYFNKGRVDLNVITELAKEMPLSREERPIWDVATLCHLGCRDITIHTRNWTPNDEQNLMTSFDIIFIKGEENGSKF